MTGIPFGRLHHRKLYARGLAKDPADEHFLPVGAAPQQEQIAGPKVWDQIRSRKAIITLVLPRTRSKNNLYTLRTSLCVRGGSEKAVLHTTPFHGDCQFFFAAVGVARFSAGVLGYAKVASFIVLSTETGIKCFSAAFWKFRL